MFEVNSIYLTEMILLTVFTAEGRYLQRGVGIYSGVKVFTAGCRYLQQGVGIYRRMQVFTAGCRYLQQGVGIYSRLQVFTAGCRYYCYHDTCEAPSVRLGIPEVSILVNLLA